MRRQRLAQLLHAPIDWPLLIATASAHGILPLCCERIAGDEICIPADVATRLREENRRHSMRSLLLMSELFRINEALVRRKIPIMSYKGPTLAQLAYGGPLLRGFADVDMVVEQKFMPQISEVMTALGYESKLSGESFVARGRQIPGEYAFVHKTHQALVEFHTEFTLRHFPRRPRMNEMAKRSVLICINGREIATFSLADNLLMLCVHGAKDFWSRLIWASDICAVAKELQAADWQELLAFAQEYDAARMIRLALALADSLFSVQIPPEIREGVAGDCMALRTAATISKSLLQGGDFPAGVIARSRYRIAMVPGWRGVGYWVRLATAPTEEDWRNSRASHSGARPRHWFRDPARLWQKKEPA